MLISVSHDTVVSNKHEEWTRHYYVNFQHNVRIKENDKWKAAFTCFHGSFEPLVMYFGLCNSPAMFQAMMNEIFTDMDDVVVVYIDDLMIFTKTENQAEHDKIVLEVLKRLEENDLFVKPKKCMFCATEVDFVE